MACTGWAWKHKTLLEPKPDFWGVSQPCCASILPLEQQTFSYSCSFWLTSRKMLMLIVQEGFKMLGNLHSYLIPCRTGPIYLCVTAWSTTKSIPIGMINNKVYSDRQNKFGHCAKFEERESFETRNQPTLRSLIFIIGDLTASFVLPVVGPVLTVQIAREQQAQWGWLIWGSSCQWGNWLSSCYCQGADPFHSMLGKCMKVQVTRMFRKIHAD